MIIKSAYSSERGGRQEHWEGAHRQPQGIDIGKVAVLAFCNDINFLILKTVLYLNKVLIFREAE